MNKEERMTHTTSTTKKCKLETESLESVNLPFIQEVKGNLFSSSSPLAHCISQDLKLGAGIAKTFREKYGPELIQVLKDQNPKIGDACVFLDEKREIYNLITKKIYKEKPTYDSLRKCLSSMKEHALSKGIEQISMPRIGCGLDGLDWKIVKEMVTEMFSKSGIEIVVYSLPFKGKKNYYRVN